MSAQATFTSSELMEIKRGLEAALMVVNKKITLAEKESTGGGVSTPLTVSVNYRKPISAEEIERKLNRRKQHRKI